MNYNIISTGSRGNAVVIEDKILIDCGVSFKALHNAYKNIQIVLLTHEHSDHFKIRTIKKLSSGRPTLRFVCGEWLKDKLLGAGVNTKNIDVVDIGKIYNYGQFKISPIKLYHNVPNFGYRIFINDEKLFYATDTNTLSGITAKDYDLYMVECNYEDSEIQERIKAKTANGKYAYEYDVLNNHLSKAKCDEFIVNNAGKNSQFIYMHQHQSKGSD